MQLSLPTCLAALLPTVSRLDCSTRLEAKRTSKDPAVWLHASEAMPCASGPAPTTATLCTTRTVAAPLLTADMFVLVVVVSVSRHTQGLTDCWGASRPAHPGSGYIHGSGDVGLGAFTRFAWHTPRSISACARVCRLSVVVLDRAKPYLPTRRDPLCALWAVFLPARGHPPLRPFWGVFCPRGTLPSAGRRLSASALHGARLAAPAVLPARILGRDNGAFYYTHHSTSRTPSSRWRTPRISTQWNRDACGNAERR